MKGHGSGVGKTASKAALRGRERSVGSATPPYEPSWVDRFIRAIQRLPIPSWLFYAAVCAILVFSVIAASWLDGSAPFGRIALPTVYVIAPMYGVLLLGAIQYLDNTAHRSFDAFRPALGLNPDAAGRLRYELTTLPAREARLTAAIGAAFGLLVLLLANVELRFAVAPVAVGVVIPVSILGFIVTAELLYHTVHQLRLVSRVHSIATAVDPFHFTPLYAFSQLSARTGLIFLLLMYFDFVVNPETFANAALLALSALGLPLLAVACFVLPLAGMHRRLVREKRRLEWDTNQRLEAAMELLHQRVDAVDLQDADALNKTVGSLMMTREFIAKTPTWPWQPGTFTVFISAVSLPVIVFLIQMFLKGLLGLK